MNHANAIDPVHSLALSMRAQPGVYAILLGSGVSRSAGMLTGWEVTLDLVRLLAKSYKEDCAPDPETWFHNKFGKAPSYSDLLGQVAKTRAERRQLLSKYWEADWSDQPAKKHPTRAHRTIASLAKRGFFRVIVTTNFDRLMEHALMEAGVNPIVLSSTDQVKGAPPLIHTKCCVFKVHGDYSDTRIRNTEEELEEYPPEFDQLLDRIFDEFGLIVCGWSAEWDGALRAALYRARSRRFTTYWALRGSAGAAANDLIQHRQGVSVQIQDADSFFVGLSQSLEAMDESFQVDPQSKADAVAQLKRYIPESRHRILLTDLIRGVVDQVVEDTSEAYFPVRDGSDITGAVITERVKKYDSVCSKLVAIATVGGAWSEQEHYLLWRDALQTLCEHRSETGTAFWLELQKYPATLLLYALGVGALSSGRVGFVEHILSTRIATDRRERLLAVQILPPFCLLENFSGHVMQKLEGMKDRKTPLSDWIHTTLRPHTKEITRREDRHTLYFDKFEMLMALNYMRHSSRTLGHTWFPCGSFIYRTDSRGKIIQEISSAEISTTAVRTFPSRQAIISRS